MSNIKTTQDVQDLIEHSQIIIDFDKHTNELIKLIDKRLQLTLKTTAPEFKDDLIKAMEDVKNVLSVLRDGFLGRELPEDQLKDMREELRNLNV